MHGKPPRWETSFCEPTNQNCRQATSASQRERSENARRQTGQQDLFFDETRRVGIFIGAPFRWLLVSQLRTVPQTDSKGVLWKAFAYFRPFTKVSARPGTRGKPCASRNSQKSTAGKPAPEKTRGEAAQKAPSQRERSENARRQTGQQDLFFDETRRVGIFIGAPFRWLLVSQLRTVPQTDSKGVLWKAFAYFRPFTKVSARPGTRGKPCASRNSQKSTAGKPAPEKTRGEAAQKAPSQRERSENARRQTGQQD